MNDPTRNIFENENSSARSWKFIILMWNIKALALECFKIRSKVKFKTEFQRSRNNNQQIKYNLNLFEF